MITVSLCMIVKNEERILSRCLDSICGLMDEIIIVDTGSTDSTKEIAARYTDKIYDFEWIDDFSAARNFAFSKASCDYIYSADADEVLDAVNYNRFEIIKKTLLPEIEIVQMKYKNQLRFKTVYNFDEEYRPKLFKRLRSFVWEEAVHETVRVSPVIYDSEIEIDHLPEDGHAKRDLSIFERQLKKGTRLSTRLHNMYARELMMAGTAEDLSTAAPFFMESAADASRTADEITEAACVLSRYARLTGNAALLMKYSSKVIVSDGCSEVCFELGSFYEAQKDYQEAIVWYYNAAFETTPVLVKESGGSEPVNGLIRCYSALGQKENEEYYRNRLKELK